MKENWKPISEQYRLAAQEGVELDAADRMLDEGKSAFIAQQINSMGDMPHSKADRVVRASKAYADYIKKMVTTKTIANRQKVELDYLKMRHMENTSAEANARSERKL